VSVAVVVVRDVGKWDNDTGTRQPRCVWGEKHSCIAQIC
jgi:hypothetical protein